MGREPINPIGSCFDSSAHQLVYGGDEYNPPGTYMCHGIGISNMPGEEGKQIGHAWLEYRVEGGAIAIDTTWGLQAPAHQYRSLIKIAYAVEYTRDEFFQLWKQHGYSGPWDSRIKAITDGK